MPDGAGALLALWNDVDPAFDAEYNDWHAYEHVPERLTVPGLLWGRRYARQGQGAMPRYLTLYGLRDTAVLDGAPYRRLLDNPTPASLRMRPRLQNLSRWVCRLQRCDGLDAGTGLVLQLFDDPPPDLGALVAERLPEAPGLPWLQAGQTQALPGRWLIAHSGNADGTRFVRLPVGDGARR